MNLDIQTRNMKVPDRLQEHAEKKLSRLDHYLPHIAQVRLDLSHEHSKLTGEQPVAQLTVRNARGTILRAEVKDQPDFFAAVDIVVDKMYRQIERYKGKQRRHGNYGDELADAEASPIDFEADSDFDPAAIVKRKQIELQPMNEDEAIEQMELLGHTFFVFYNADAGMVNVVYRRNNGGYGLIQPLFG